MNDSPNIMTAPIVVAAGGTGGHLFPAQALAAEMVKRGRKIVLITDNRGEGFSQRFPNADIRHIRAATFAGAGVVGRISAAVKIVLGIYDAIRVLRQTKPRVVIGFGGYPSFPTMVAAMVCGVRRCVHEQNAILGRVNKVIATRINLIASTFGPFEDVSASVNQKVVVTGNPLRDPIIAQAQSPYPEISESGELNLLVFGGSQGARVFSDVVPDALRLLPDSMRNRLRVVQQARPEDVARVEDAFQQSGIAADVSAFFEDMARRISESHLIVCRSGASTVCEIAAIGRPAIFVPLPTAMDDHQTVNASFLAAKGGGWLMRQNAMTAEALAGRIIDLFHNPEELRSAAAEARSSGRTQATSYLADVLEDVEARRPVRGPQMMETGAVGSGNPGRAVRP